MCEECGCEDGEKTEKSKEDNNKTENNNKTEKTEKKESAKSQEQILELNSSLTSFNDAIAEQNREFLKNKKVFCINLMGSPGSGKTTVLEQISKHLDPGIIAVIQGDLESDVDKQRLEKIKINSYQINTHSGCHLNASMVNKALMDMNMEGKKYLFIENVGNLVCPSGVDIGQHMNIVASSTAEGSDKPKKYPNIFRTAQIVLITKQDLAEAAGFDEKSYIEDLSKITKARIVKTSSKEPGTFQQAASMISHKRDHFFNLIHKH